jgi:hypothetical protein
MTNRRRSQARATSREDGFRHEVATRLKVVPRTVASAAEQSAGNLANIASIAGIPGISAGTSRTGAAGGSGAVRSSLLRRFDFHPALTILTAVAIIALVCIIYLGQVTAVANANYTLQALQEEHTRLMREQEDLLLQIGRAQSLPNIEKMARQKLNMQPVGDNYSYLPVTAGPLTAVTPLPTPTLPGEAGQP